MVVVYITPDGVEGIEGTQRNYRCFSSSPSPLNPANPRLQRVLRIQLGSWFLDSAASDGSLFYSDSPLLDGFAVYSTPMGWRELVVLKVAHDLSESCDPTNLTNPSSPRNPLTTLTLVNSLTLVQLGRRSFFVYSISLLS